MKRFFGLMPANEIEIEKDFLDDYGLHIQIQAGKHGWTIIYPDKSTDYEDNDAKASENFKRAYDHALTIFDSLKECK